MHDGDKLGFAEAGEPCRSRDLNVDLNGTRIATLIGLLISQIRLNRRLDLQLYEDYQDYSCTTTPVFFAGFQSQTPFIFPNVPSHTCQFHSEELRSQRTGRACVFSGIAGSSIGFIERPALSI